MPPPPRQGSGGKCLIGCGILALILVVCCAGGIWWSVNYLPGIMLAQGTELARTKIIEEIEKSDLREEDKQVIVEQVNRVAKETKEGKVTVEQALKIMQNLAESPLVMIAMAYGIEEKYLNRSGLDDAEKQEAKLTLQRAARGVFEQKISQEQLKEAMRPISNEKPDGNLELKEQVTDDELRQFLTDLKQLADDASIPDELFQVDIGAEVKKAVDDALGESS
jgi:hypothetical protein